MKMKHLWRTIAIVMMIVFCLVGIAMTIVDTVRAGKIYNGGYAFTTFLTEFIRTLSLTAVWGLLIEVSKNVEDWLEKIFRNNAGLEQLPDSPDFITAGINKIASAANTANTTNMQQPYSQQPMQQPYNQQPYPQQQPPMGQPMNNIQAAPQPVPQAVPMQQPVPAPVAQPTPAPVAPAPQPVPAPVPQPAPAAQPETWTCSCGAVNNPNANFCKGCGKPRS